MNKAKRSEDWSRFSNRMLKIKNLYENLPLKKKKVADGFMKAFQKMGKYDE